MPQVRCPRCGTTNQTRKPDYPFCVGCQDNLARCGYCRFFDSSAVACSHPLAVGVFDVSEEATPPCGYHVPRDAIQVRRRGVQALVWVGVGAALFALGFGLWELFQVGNPPPPVAPPAPELQLAVEADYAGATVGQPYTVEVVLYNTSDSVVEEVQLYIALASLDVLYLDPSNVRPKPKSAEKSGEWLVLEYPELNSWERRRIALELMPREAGELHLKVRLFSGEHVYHGQCNLPITVAAGEAADLPPINESREEEGE